MRSNWSLTLVLALAVMLSSCSSVYYGAMEKVGYPKRDLMVSRVAAAQKSQRDAKEVFRSAMNRFKEVVNVPGSTLETKHAQLKIELDRCESRAKDVHSRISSVADVSEALFDEWKTELNQYKSDSLRQKSERKLDQTRARYTQLIGAMKNAESRIEPVLQPLRDDVLYLKHNLNAKAISTLSVELDAVQTNVDSLVADLERSIAEADHFIGEIKSEN